MTARELARDLAVSMRTVHRDIDALCEAGIPIHAERGSLGGIVLADDYRRSLAQFTNDELQALFASGSGPMTDLGIGSQTQALRKLAGALPAMQRHAAETSRDRLFVDHNRWSRGEQPTEILMCLRKAAERDRRVRLSYRDREGIATERLVDLLGLVAKAGVWYLIAREPDKGYRTFRAQRIAGADELAETFARPTDFDLETYWNASVLAIERQSQETFDAVVRLRRDAVVKLAAFFDVTIEREEGDHSVLRVGFPSLDVAISHVIVLGDAVEIVSPTGLPDAIVARAEAAIRTFGGERSGDPVAPGPSDL